MKRPDTPNFYELNSGIRELNVLQDSHSFNQYTQLFHLFIIYWITKLYIHYKYACVSVVIQLTDTIYPLKMLIISPK